MLFFGARTEQRAAVLRPADEPADATSSTSTSRSRARRARRKRYVQDAMRERAADVAALLADPQTFVYVCGLKGMEAGVLEALRDIARGARPRLADAVVAPQARGPAALRDVLKFADFHAGQHLVAGPATLSRAGHRRVRARLGPAVVPHRPRARCRRPLEGPHRERLADVRASRCGSRSTTCSTDSESFGSPGLDYLKWLQPVRPGDALTLHADVLEARRSATQPTLGILRWRWQSAQPARRRGARARRRRACSTLDGAP